MDSNKQSKFKKFIYKVLKKKDIEKEILDEKDGDLDVANQGVEEEIQQ